MLKIWQKYGKIEDLSAYLGYFLILCWDEDHCDTPAIFHDQFYMGRKAGSKRTLRKASGRISLLSVSRLQGNVQPCSCDHKIFMCSCLWPGLDEKLEWDSVCSKSFQEKNKQTNPCLESWGAVCSYLCSNSGRTISWSDLWEVVQADIPGNWNLRTHGLLPEDWILPNVLLSFYSQAEIGWMTDFRLFSYVWILAASVPKQTPCSFCCLCFGRGNLQEKARNWYWRQHQFSCSIYMCLHPQVSTDRQVSRAGWYWRCGGSWSLSLWMCKFHLLWLSFSSESF